MKLVPYDKAKLGYVSYGASKNFALLKEFMDSDLDCVEVEGYPHKDAASCQSSLYGSMKNFGFNNIKIVARGDRVFLVRKDRL